MDEHKFIAGFDFQKLIQNLEKWIDFKKWGFKLVYSKPNPKSQRYFIVYQSEQCKIRFRWEQDRPYESPSIQAEYGRVHAPPDEYYMMWNGEKRWCWHEISRTINYLDGLSPAEANSSIPSISRKFHQSSIGKLYDQPEHYAKFTAHIWEHYGQQIFNLYDLRQTDSWNQYVDFIEECGKNSEQQARDKGHAWDSTLYKIC